MKADRTMLLLADTFIGLTETCSIDKITISKIVKTCGRNRKTFYYYFLDTNELIIWIFRHDLGCLLLQHIEHDKLVFETASHESQLSSVFKYPYYMFNKTGIRTLDHSAFFTLLARTFDNRRTFYTKVFKQTCTEPRNLKDYLFGLYTPALQRDIEFVLGNRYLQPRNINLLAEFYAGAFINDLSCRTISSSCKTIEVDFSLFGNLVHNALSREVEEQRLHRKL